MVQHRSTFTLALMLVALACCATPIPPNEKLELAKAPLSSPLRWRADPDCLAQAPWQATRVGLAQECAALGRARNHDFVALALSGGGTKAAVFAGEAMFYFQALGLLRNVDVISSVSGGSFTAALYGLSCDPGDAECQQRSPPGAHRPVWSYQPVMSTLAQGYESLVEDALLRIVVPGLRPTVSGSGFADFIEEKYLAAPAQPPYRFRFADLNPRRPHLFLNSTLVSDFRPFLEGSGNIGLEKRHRGRGYLRRRTADEFFHFAFTDYYFNLLASDLTNLRLAYGVAASAAFPVLIDYVRLQDFADCPEGECRQLLLLDGGANDNQGLIEIYMAMSELAGGQARSDLSTMGPPALEPIGPDDKALVLVVNSSLTESTGVHNDPKHDPSSGFWLLRTLERSFAEIDTYSAVGYNLRKRLYLREAERLRDDALARWRRPLQLRLAEIGLTELDHYAEGGVEASLRTQSGTDAHDRNALYDPDRKLMDWRRQVQRVAFTPFKRSETRTRLGLTHWHPQCLFERMKSADTAAGLAGLPPDAIACLRHAARWAAALRAQELCNEMAGRPETAPLDPRAGFRCDVSGGVPTLRPDETYAEIIRGEGLDECRPELDPATAEVIKTNAPYFRQPGAMLNRDLDSLCGDLDELERH
jgi:Patatin-like phospholipase